MQRPRTLRAGAIIAALALSAPSLAQPAQDSAKAEALNFIETLQDAANQPLAVAERRLLLRGDEVLQSGLKLGHVRRRSLQRTNRRKVVSEVIRE